MQPTFFGPKQAKVQAQTPAENMRSAPQELLPAHYKLVTGGAPRGTWQAAAVSPMAPRGTW